MADLYCPFCGSKKFHLYEEGDAFNPYDRYECDECQWLFDEQEIERQELRHQISCFLDGTSEENPKEIYFMIPTAEEEACGLSALEIPHIDKIFEVEGEGTMWYHIDGCYTEIGGNELEWLDLDTLEIIDLRGLLKYLQEE